MSSRNRKPLSPIPDFKLERYFARWEFEAPYLLCTSDVQGYAMKDLLPLAGEEERALWKDLTLGYTETRGHPLLRQEIAGIYTRAQAEDVLCFTSAEEAIYVCARVLVRPGDHVITTFPGYQSVYQVAETIGAQVSRLVLGPAPGRDGRETWKFDLDELRRLIRPNTRLLLVNFPNNPTGALPEAEEWQALLQVAREANLVLFSDEVYRLMEYDPADRLPAAADGYERAISLGTMSKPFGLAGLRTGWVACRDADLLDQLTRYKDYTSICGSAPSEILALIGLRARERVLARSMGIIRANLALVDEFMRTHADSLEWLRPKAGSVAFPRWLGEGTIEQFASALVQAEGVLLLPGSVFDVPGNHFRLGLGRTNMAEGLERLSRFIKDDQGIPAHNRV
ncbi:MAG: aminotransferase class I/II-fold pyridoxal phosphate-dependent enzyme [Anaerolineaceae bacterium]|nr:aminotransferase class I/II-fold pyridoxal phosphate-dependent enzyme [Anaerolineaceae bacterium]